MSKEANSTRKPDSAQRPADDEAAGEKHKEVREFAVQKLNRLRFARSTSAEPARKTGRTTARKISSATNPRRSI